MVRTDRLHIAFIELYPALEALGQKGIGWKNDRTNVRVEIFGSRT